MTYTIAVGIDGSEHSRAALRWALAQAEAHHGEVTAVLAWQVPFLSFPRAFNKSELEQAANYLNTNFAGLRVDDIRTHLLRELKEASSELNRACICLLHLCA